MRFPFPVIFLLAWTSWCCEAAQIRTNFVATGVLSSLEVSNVVRLAEECGISNVAEVSTVYQRPSTSWAICVKSQEIVTGRRIDYQTLQVFSDSGSGPWRQPSASQPPLRVGQFWVPRTVHLPVVDHEALAFETGTGEIRVEILGDIPLEIADKIVNSFAAGRIRFADENVRRRGEPGTLTLPRTFVKPAYSHPTEIRKSPQESHYSISFSDSLDEYVFDLDGEEVNILTVIHINI
jgi:hypothetical protein